MAFYTGDVSSILDINNLKNEFKKRNPLRIKISELIISVQSAKARMNIDIDIKQLSKHLLKYIENNKDNKFFPVVGLHYKNIRYGTLCKKKSNKKKKEMPNNVAISITSRMNTG